MARRRRKKGPSCPNCGTALHAEFEFCPHCGQENHDLRVPFRTFLYEFVENLTHFDTKAWNTLKVIFTRPGQLTKDYVEGKRARYVNPARFYIFFSVIFFALVTLWLDRAVEQQQQLPVSGGDPQLRLTTLPDIIKEITGSRRRWDSLTVDEVSVRIPIDSPFYGRVAARLRHPEPRILDSLLAEAEDTLPGARAVLREALATLPHADSLNMPYSVFINGMLTSFTERREERWFHKGEMTEADVDSLLGDDRDSVGWFGRRAIRSLGRVNLSTAEGKKRIGHAIVKATSVIMFILMPFTAVLLLWIFFRRRYYWEHLIFSVHIHTIYFLFFSIALLLELVLPRELPGWSSPLLAVICLGYLILALRRVYARGWPATVARMLSMSIPYLLVFLVLMAAGVVWGLFSL